MGGVIAAEEVGSGGEGVGFAQHKVSGGDGRFGQGEGVDHVTEVDDADGWRGLESGHSRSDEEVVVVGVVVDDLGAQMGQVEEHGRFIFP